MITKRRKKGKPYQIALFSLFFIVLIFILVGFFFYSNWKTYQQRRGLNLRIESLKKDISALQEKKKELEASASQFSQEEYLEKVAREQLNLQKSGEQVVTVLPSEEEKKGEEPKEEKSFWQKVLDRIGF